MLNEHEAKRYGDQYHCSKCGKQWDADDQDPPECIDKPQHYIDQVRAKLRTKKSEKL